MTIYRVTLPSGRFIEFYTRAVAELYKMQYAGSEITVITDRTHLL
jgi:hypothetical protein